MVKRWLKRISDSARTRQYIARLALSYLIIVFVWMIILFFVGNAYIKKLVLSESISNNHKSLATLTAMVDGYVLGSLKEIANNLYEDCRTDYYVSKYMSAELSGDIVDTLQVQRFLLYALSRNPNLESLSIYYPENDLLVTTSAILYPEKKEMFMGDMPARFEQLVAFSEAYRWVSDLDYPVIEGALRTTQDGTFVPAATPAIHFISKIPEPNRGTKIGCYLILSLREDYLYNILRSRDEQGVDQLILVDQTGTVASAGNRHLLGQNLIDLNLSEIASDARSVNPVDKVYFNGEDRAASICLSPLTNWHYVIDVAVNRSTKINQVILQMITATVLLATVITILLAFLSSRSLYRPVRGIASRCRQLYPQLSGGQNEVQLISQTIQSMETKLDSALQIQADSCPLVRLGVMRQLFDVQYTSPVDLQEALLMMAIEMPWPDCCAWRIDLTGEPAEVTTYADHTTRQLDRLFNTRQMTCLTSTDGTVIYVLFNFGRDQFDPLACARQLVAEPPVHDTQSMKQRLSCGPVVLLEDAQQSTRLCSRAAAYHWLFANRQLIQVQDIIGREQTAATLILEPHLKALDTAMKAMDPDQVLAAFDTLIEAVRTTPCTIEQARQALQIVSHTLRAALQSTMAVENELVIMKLDSLFRLSQNIQEIRDGLPELLQDSARIKHEHALVRDQLLVQNAQAYIQKNLANSQLSLQGVADDLGISASHFSRIFKRETGMVFLEYVNDLRLQLCSQMLRDTNQRIAQIAEALGYSTPQYLASRFKIKYGCTPKEYRLFTRTKPD